MQTVRWRFGILLEAVGVLVAFASVGLAQETTPPPSKYLGPTRCADCHNAPNPLRFRDFVLQTESARFIAEDKHVQAFELLKGELGQAMTKRLGITDITEARQCLSCHAGWLQDQPKPPHFEFGVSCESCHGPSSQWDTPHSEPAWRLKSPADKTKLGLFDVRNPVTRAEQCFSCHIGNVEQGKVITHEMYAAGHPPLPSIEIESFVDQMPSHWRYLQEKGPFESRAEYVKLNYPQHPHDPGLDLPRTRSTVVGGLVALRESLELFSSQAKPENPQWPELALFDCQACHHDLRSPSWRQQRDAQFAPGRPTLPEWPFALVNLSLRQIAGDDEAQYQKLAAEFTQHRQQLYASIQKQPFGDKQAAGRAAEFAQWLEPHIQTLATSRFDLPAATRSIRELSTLGPKEFPDFHSARQRVWALGIIQRERDTPYPTWPAAEPNTSASERRAAEAANIALFEKWRDDVFAPQRQAWANRWERQKPPFDLPLILPSGQKQVIERNLPQSLQAISNYDAAVFRRLLDELKATPQPRP
ncbi:MAG: multiheme c-type cytochrome [Planctomycetota bacterium]